MNKLIFSIVIALCSHVILTAQTGNRSFSELTSKFKEMDEGISQCFDNKDYPGVEKATSASIKLFSSMSYAEQQQKKRIQAVSYYNLACAYSMQKKKDKAIEAFRTAVEDWGWADYSHAKVDTDLDNIRDEKGFIKTMEKIREHGDFLFILQKAGSYQKEDRSSLPVFEYENINNGRIQAVRKYFNLDSIAGKGDEMSRIINIMNWVHKSIRHDGSNYALCEFDAIDIYNYHKATGKGVNCRHLAIALNECYLSMGFKSRFITCLPKREDDNDCHVIASVYSSTLDKWVWMDPSFNAYLKDENGNFLSIEEVRSRLISNQPVVLNDDANWNGNPTKKEWYVDSYMAKNLYWFNCPARSFFNVESQYRNSNEAYISLMSLGYANANQSGGSTITCDPDYFWQAPEIKREITASTTLMPTQMRKDIDFFFETVAKVHANMYAFVSKDEISKIREQLYQDCSKPMTAVDFNMRIRQLNGLFDGHTSISFKFRQVLNNYDGFFPMPVNFTGGEIYLLDDEGKSGKRIISINGAKAKDIYNRMVNTNEIKEAGEIRASSNFSTNLYINTNLRSPYTIILEGTNGDEAVTLQGVSQNNIKRLSSGFDNAIGLGFRMYPEKSIAIIDYNTCNFYQDSINQWRLNHWFDVRFKQIAENKIKTLFIDISRNGGGNSDNNNVIFKYIKHDNAIKLAYLIQSRYQPYANDGQKELNYLKNDTFTMVTPPNPKGFDGDIYLIQGPGSYSAAIGVAEWFNALDKAKLIGEQTGQATAVYIDTSPFTLPESQIPFGCSFKYWTSLPVGHEDKGVQPNYRVKLDYSKSYYDLNDLLGFIAQINPGFKYKRGVSPEGANVAVKSATANYFQEGENIDKALDGNLNTLYHSPWKGIEFPVVLTFNFEGQQQIDFFKYYPRPYDPANGLFGKVEIWASTQSDPTLRKIGLHDFYQASVPGYYQFSKSLKNPLKIELRVLSSMNWDGLNHASCAEIEFYKKTN